MTRSQSVGTPIPAAEARVVYVRTEHPEFSWSHTRARTLERCERRYYWHYYGSHNGWERGARPEAQLAWRLKKLTAYPTELGVAVHRCARDLALALRDGKPAPERHTLAEQARGALNRLYLRSKDPAAFRSAPSQHVITADAYYGRAVPRERLQALGEKLDACLRHLVACRVWEELRLAPSREVRVVDDLAHLFVDGVKVYVAPDLIFRTPRTGWVVVDWKTGRDEDVADQLALYALYARDGLGVPLRDEVCECRVVHLDTGTVDAFDVEPLDLEAAARRIGMSVKRMHEFLEDPAANIARGKAAFGLAEDPRDCRYCQYRELCEPEFLPLGRRRPPVS